MIFGAMESPHTPEPDAMLKEATTPERSACFWHVDNRGLDETMKSIAEAHGIRTSTGKRWKKQRRDFGTPGTHRIRKFNAHFKKNKLGRPYKISKETLNVMCSPSRNPHQFLLLGIQMGKYEVNIHPRTMECNLKTRKHNA